MKKVFGTIVVALVYIYIGIATFVAFPYYNWCYARDYGFVRWVFCGEIIATLKATIWPYYALTASTGLEEAEAHMDVHFADSTYASREAFSIIERFGSVTELPSDEAANVVRLLNTCVTEAGLVDDSYLHRVHPELVRRFRDQYCRAHQDLAEGIRTGDQEKVMSAATTYHSFTDWVNVHAKEMDFQ